MLDSTTSREAERAEFRREDATTWSLGTIQRVSVPRDDLFPFFADAANLARITPPEVGFHILTPQPIAMRAGTLIDYRIRLWGIPMPWRTEITTWNPPHHFVDEQKRGPYRLWIHEHTFTPQNGGTLCTDRIRYAVLGGDLIHWLFVRRDVERIFKYRATQLQALFPASPSSGNSV